MASKFYFDKNYANQTLAIAYVDEKDGLNLVYEIPNDIVVHDERLAFALIDALKQFHEEYSAMREEYARMDTICRDMIEYLPTASLQHQFTMRIIGQDDSS